MSVIKNTLKSTEPPTFKRLISNSNQRYLDSDVRNGEVLLPKPQQFNIGNGKKAIVNYCSATPNPAPQAIVMVLLRAANDPHLIHV